MKRLLSLVLCATLLFGCMACGSNTPQKEQVVKELVPRQIGPNNRGYEVRTHYRKDGDFKIANDDEFTLAWEKNGCSVNRSVWNSDDPEHVMDLTFGEPILLRADIDPGPVIYRCYYCYEDDSLPEEWMELLENMDRIQKAQESYGSFASFAQSRDVDAETAIIEPVIADAGLTGTTADESYQFFLDALWNNGDTEVRIEKAAIRVETNEDHPDYKEHWIVLTCSDGNEYEMLSGFVVTCNGNLYYGPME